jgi:hypothetical protein
MKYIDIFGYPIQFTYKSDHTFKTFRGAVLTILVILMIGVYVGNGIKDIAVRKSTVTVSAI